ncbi:conserved hypothetical protein [Anaeromyxobacter sp. K]|uniref:hypothetical protein n=1 Tax=Anaeromyxobacter sp. (strain K) TaxID=447217 RepID=UPI00017BE2ED|nr:hypothetical protein [Anaeromyxobacter sp. K]ACG73326.1 conserved hypothetical protein [Anaeromyxobacter sp. K]
MAEQLDELLEQVCDEASFLRFVRALGDDFAAGRVEDGRNPQLYWGSVGPRGWKHLTVDAFLHSAATSGETSARQQPAAANPWRRCAEMLHAGKH